MFGSRTMFGSGTLGSTRETAALPRTRVRELVSFLGICIELTKPGVTRMVLATTWCGAVLAPGRIVDYARFGWALLGTALIVGSANALNMYLESDVDALMARTRTRPIPSGRAAPDLALWFGLILGFTGFPILQYLVNPLTAFIGGVALLSYVLAYTPMKRLSPVAVWIGAIPGAAPPLIGYTAMTGKLDLAGSSLFLLLFIWQIPHFHAIAIYRVNEYRRAGLKVLPDVRGVAYTKRAIAGLLVLQVLASLLPAVSGIGGRVYLIAALVLGAAYLGFGLQGFRTDANARWARSLFFASMPYLLGLLGVLVATAR